MQRCNVDAGFAHEGAVAQRHAALPHHRQHAQPRARRKLGQHWQIIGCNPAQCGRQRMFAALLSRCGQADQLIVRGRAMGRDIDHLGPAISQGSGLVEQDGVYAMRGL